MKTPHTPDELSLHLSEDEKQQGVFICTSSTWAGLGVATQQVKKKNSKATRSHY